MKEYEMILASDADDRKFVPSPPRAPPAGCRLRRDFLMTLALCVGYRYRLACLDWKRSWVGEMLVASSHAACVLLMPGTSHAFESLTSFPVTSRIRHIKSCDDSYEPLEISSDRRACEQSFRRLVSARSLPPLPSGETLVVGLGSLTDCSTGGWVWSAAAVLCECEH